jgi:hypothetical protein
LEIPENEELPEDFKEGKVEEHNNTFYYKENKLHRERGLPAIIYGTNLNDLNVSKQFWIMGNLTGLFFYTK